MWSSVAMGHEDVCCEIKTRQKSEKKVLDRSDIVWMMMLSLSLCLSPVHHVQDGVVPSSMCVFVIAHHHHQFGLGGVGCISSLSLSLFASVLVYLYWLLLACELIWHTCVCVCVSRATSGECHMHTASLSSAFCT